MIRFSGVEQGKAVDDFSKKTPGKKAIAIKSFSNVLFKLPTIIADNAENMSNPVT